MENVITLRVQQKSTEDKIMPFCSQTDDFQEIMDVVNWSTWNVSKKDNRFRRPRTACCVIPTHFSHWYDFDAIAQLYEMGYEVVRVSSCRNLNVYDVTGQCCVPKDQCEVIEHLKLEQVKKYYSYEPWNNIIDDVCECDRKYIEERLSRRDYGCTASYIYGLDNPVVNKIIINA